MTLCSKKLSYVPKATHNEMAVTESEPSQSLKHIFSIAMPWDLSHGKIYKGAYTIMWTDPWR